MAIDVSTFAADLPAGTYTAGDVIELGNVAGPAVVRSGRGPCSLKRTIASMATNESGSVTAWEIYVQNSDWVDPAISVAIPLSYATALDVRSSAIQSGHDCNLTPNSSWRVWAVCTNGGTTTVANSVIMDIEVDYPQVSAIIDPTQLIGIPASIKYSVTGLAINATGTATTAGWTTFNVDLFKAGYEYALEKIELTVVGGSVSVAGHVAISNAAGMGGLTRIIPISNSRANIRPFIEYASKLQKGPMDISFKLYNQAGTATTATVNLIMDFVKRKV